MNELLETTARRHIALVISAVTPNVRELMDQAVYRSPRRRKLLRRHLIALDRAKELMAQKG